MKRVHSTCEFPGKEIKTNPLKSIMGRRQFLIATGVASTCALACKKLAGFQARNAVAAKEANASLTYNYI